MISDLCGQGVEWTFDGHTGRGKIRGVYPGDPGCVARVLVEVVRVAPTDPHVAGDLLDLNIQQVRVLR